MATTNNQKFDHAEVVRKTKVETTYEYVPILGEILGYWRKQRVNRLGSDIEVHLNHDITGYDRVILNGKDITSLLSDKS